MSQHTVTNIPLLVTCLILIVLAAILSFIKSDGKTWYLYVIALAVIEAISIIYLAFL